MGAHINKYYTYQIDAADIYTRTEGGETHPATTSIFTCDHTSISKLISIHTDTGEKRENTYHVRTRERHTRDRETHSRSAGQSECHKHISSLRPTTESGAEAADIPVAGNTPTRK